MLSFLSALSSIVLFPLIILNMIGGVVGGVWLAVTGDWKTLVIGLLGIFIGPMIIGIVLMPGSFISGAAIYLADGGIGRRIVALPFLILSMSWTVLVMVAWAILSFSVLGGIMSENGITIQSMLWSYSVATAPWVFLGQKDLQSGNDESGVQVFFLEISCVLFAVGLWFDWTPPAIGFFVVMGILLLSNVIRGVWGFLHAE